MNLSRSLRRRLDRRCPQDALASAAARLVLWVGIILGCLGCTVAVAEEVRQFGEITLQRLPGLPEGKTHGSHEYVFRLSNSSLQQPHEVILRLPATQGGGNYGLASFETQVRVAPQATMEVSLLQPELPINGQDIAVVVDGDLQDTVYPWNNEHPLGRMTVGGMHSTSRTPMRLLVGRRSNAADLPDPADDGGTSPLIPFQVLEASVPIAQWSERWLAYSGYDGIVLSWQEMNAAPPGVAAALWRYVEAGGNLLLFEVPALNLPTTRLPSSNGLPSERPKIGGRSLPFPVTSRQDGPWVDADGNRLPADELAWSYVGLGELLWTSQQLAALSTTAMERLGQAWTSSRAPWAMARNIAQVHRQMPVIETINVPLRSLFLLVLVFSLLVAPINLWWLSRRRRRIWLLWTVPAMSLLACVLVVVVALVGEGFQYKGRSLGLTLLDQSQQWATTLAWSGYYASTGTDGLRFSLDTEVAVLGGGDNRRRLRVDGEQRLTQGWLVPRLPTYLLERRHQKRRERLEVTWGDDSIWVVNGLGADLEWLVVADASGRTYRSQGPLAAGAKAELPQRMGQTAGATPEVLRGVFGGDFPRQLRHLWEAPEAALQPSTYLALSRRSPFLEVALAQIETPRHDGLIYGLLGETP